MLTGKVKTILRKIFGAKPARKRKRKDCILRLEEMESRVAPAMWVVTSLADRGPNTLRDILSGVQTLGGPGTPTIADNDTVELRVPLPDLPNNASAGQFQAIIGLLSPITCDKSVTIDGLSIYDPSAPRRIRGPLPAFYSITIDGGRDANDPLGAHQGLIFRNANGPVNETISLVSFRNCWANQGGAADNGGAIAVTGGLSLDSCRFTNNRSAGNGAAVYVKPLDAGTNVTITLSTFTNNHGNAGGAVYIDPVNNNGQEVAANITVNDSFFERNRSSRSGAAINVTGALQTLSVGGSIFTNNRTDDLMGGGIYAECLNLNVTGGSFSGNGITSAEGGAISWNPRTLNVALAPSLNLENITFVGNSAHFGGAVACTNTSALNNTTATINGCLFVLNRTNGASDLRDEGGGLYVSDSTRGQATFVLDVSNATFYDNTSRNYGGAIYIEDNRANVITLTSLTINDNWAGNQGGGLFTSTPAPATPPIVRNSIIAENSSTEGPDVYGTVNSRGFNLVKCWDGSVGFNAGQNGDLNGVPGLQGLAENGGLTRTMAVPATSPAYRTGDPGLRLGGAPVNKDQRGQTRNDMQNGNPKVTIGAYDQGARGNAANQAPAGANNTVTTLEDTSYAFRAADFGFTDPYDSPANQYLAVKITTLPSTGILTYAGVPIVAGQFISVTGIGDGGLVFYPVPQTSGNF